MRSGNISEFRSFSKFRDLKDFNNAIEQWMVDVKDEFTKGELIGLKRLIRYAAKVPGVCNAKIQTLVSACQENGGISRRTFERMLLKARELGLLEVVHTFNGHGKQGHSVYVFNRYVMGDVSFTKAIDVPKQAKIDAPLLNKTDDLLETSKTIIINNRYEDMSNVPLKFQRLGKIAFTNEEILELWKAVKQEAYHTENASNFDKTISIGVHALRILIAAIKRWRIENKVGYFKMITRNVFKQLECGPVEEHYESKQANLPIWMDDKALKQFNSMVDRLIKKPKRQMIQEKHLEDDFSFEGYLETCF